MNLKTAPASDQDQKTNSRHQYDRTSGPAAMVQTRPNMGKTSDPHEQEADRVADEVVNGSEKPKSEAQTAQRNLIQPKSMLSAPKNLIQRYAFVDDEQISQYDSSLSPAMHNFASDFVVRDYEHMGEFQAHADGNTDHIGNFKRGPYAGVWMRFDRWLPNIVGEIHHLTPLKNTVEAVGADSFIGEYFPVEELGQTPQLYQAWSDEGQRDFDQMNLPPLFDYSKYASDSLYAKIGQVMSALVELLDFVKMFKTEKLHPQSGYTMTKYLKMAWALADDFTNEWQQNGVSNTYEQEVLDAYRDAHPVLNDFITNLTQHGNLYDSFRGNQNGQLFPPLRRFTGAMSTMLAHRMLAEEHAGITPGLPEFLRNNPHNYIAHSDLMQDIRNQTMLERTRQAVIDGVRYIGIGGRHYEHLGRNMPEGSHGTNLDVAEMNKRKASTERLWIKARQNF